jgi:hypothetical protein
MGDTWIEHAIALACVRFADPSGGGGRDLVSTVADVFYLEVPNADDMRRRAAEMEAFLAACDPRSVKCHVRIRLDLCLEVRDGRGLRERDFRVLCALKSALGQKPYMRVSREWLRVRAAGFLRPEEEPAALARGESGGPKPHRVLSLQQVRTSLGRLDGFFASVRANPWQTYYSDKMGQAELVEAVFQLKTRRATQSAEKRDRSANLWARIKNARESHQGAHGATTPSSHHTKEDRLPPAGRIAADQPSEIAPAGKNDRNLTTAHRPPVTHATPAIATADIATNATTVRETLKIDPLRETLMGDVPVVTSSGVTQQEDAHGACKSEKVDRRSKETPPWAGSSLVYLWHQEQARKAGRSGR